MADMWIFIILGGIPALLGAVFWLIGYFRTKKTRNWENTLGEIVKKSKWAPGLPDYRPTVRFEAKDGGIYEVTSSVNQSPGLMPGRRVPVLYDPADPYRAVIDTLVQSGRIFLIVGTILFGIGAVIIGLALLAIQR